VAAWVAWHVFGPESGMSFYTVAPMFTEKEIEALENQANNPAELFIIRRFLENHARRSLTETKESIGQSYDTAFLDSYVNLICSGLTKHPHLPDAVPNVELVVNHLSDFILAKAKQSGVPSRTQPVFPWKQFFPNASSTSRDQTPPR